MKKVFFWVGVAVYLCYCAHVDAVKENKVKYTPTTSVSFVSTSTPIKEKTTPTEKVTTKRAKEKYYGRCLATTKRGTQCKRNAANGSCYCWQHQ